MEFSAIALGISSRYARSHWAYLRDRRAWESVPDTQVRRRPVRIPRRTIDREFPRRARRRTRRGWSEFPRSPSERIARAAGFCGARCDQREQENWNACKKLIEREQERRMAQAVDEPALRDDLHPGADGGGAGADPHKAKIAILKSFEDSAQRRSLHGLEAGFGVTVYLRTNTSFRSARIATRNRILSF